VAGGILFGAALKLVMKSVVMPLFGADPVNQAFRYLAGNTAALPWVLYAVILVRCPCFLGHDGSNRSRNHLPRAHRHGVVVADERARLARRVARQIPGPAVGD
jgi:hypothetical protein